MTPPALGAHTTVEQVVREQLLKAVGGWRGAVEAAVPLIAFVVALRVLPAGDDAEQPLVPALVVAGVIMAVIMAIRLAQRQTLQYVFGGVFALALSAAFALSTGDPKAIALPGILINAGVGAVYLLSVIIGWPAIGFVYGAALQDLTGWQRSPGLRSLFTKITAVLLANYVIRVAVQLPLYLAEAPLEVQLGAKLALGWPLLAAGVVIIGILLARGNTPIDREALLVAERSDHSEHSRHSDRSLGRSSEDGSGLPPEHPVQDRLGDVPAAGHDQHP